MNESIDDAESMLEIFEIDTLKNISFSGGGFKGVAFLGVLKALLENANILKNC